MTEDKKYTDEIKLKAKEMYLRGATGSSIAREVTKLTGRNCSPALVGYWAKAGNWKEERNKIMSTTTDQITKVVGDDLFKRTQEQLDMYQEMTKMGFEAIKDETVTPVEVNDAVNLIDKGIRGERMIRQGLVSWRYVEQVVQVIIEEVRDDETRKRIASKLRGITEGMLSV